MATSTSMVVNQAPTNLGPLTTVFTQPPECTAAVAPTNGGLLGLGLLGGGIGDVALLGQTCANGDPADATSCWPPTSSGVEVPDGRLGGWGFYSPGLECPAGHAAACTATGGAGGNSDWPVQFELKAGETALGCCPSGFGCDNINGQTCIMVATSTAVPMATCQGDRTGDVVTQDVPDQKASITAFSMLAPMIQINFQSSDLPEKSTQPPAAQTTDPPPAAQKTDPPPPPAEQSDPPPPPPPPNSNDAGAAATTNTEPPPPPPPAQATSTQEAGQGGAPPPQPTETESTGAAANAAADAQGSSAAQSEGQAQENNDGDDSDRGVGSLSKAATMGVFIGGGSAALILIGSSIIFFVRRRRKVKEESELDRLYGLDKLDTGTGQSRADQFPGFSYRGNGTNF